MCIDFKGHFMMMRWFQSHFFSTYFKRSIQNTVMLINISIVHSVNISPSIEQSNLLLKPLELKRTHKFTYFSKVTRMLKTKQNKKKQKKESKTKQNKTKTKKNSGRKVLRFIILHRSRTLLIG